MASKVKDRRNADPYASGSASDGYSSSGNSRRVNRIKDVFFGDGASENRYLEDGGTSDYFNPAPHKSAAQNRTHDDDYDARRSGPSYAPAPRAALPQGHAVRLTAEDLVNDSELAQSADVWSIQNETGIEIICNALITGTLDDLTTKCSWPENGDVFKKILAQCKSRARLGTVARNICKSAARAGVIIPLKLEVLNAVNTSPHIVGWSTKSALDRQHVINAGTGSRAYMHVVQPSSSDAQSSMPYTVDLRETMSTEDMAMYSFLGSRTWEEVVTMMPERRKTGEVLEGSFVHKMLKEYDVEARKTPGDGPHRNAIIDWEHTGTTVDGHAVWRTGIPVAALMYAREIYEHYRTVMSEYGIRTETFSLVCQPVLDNAWNSLAYTKHHDLSAETRSAEIIRKQTFFTVGITFRLRGLW